MNNKHVFGGFGFSLTNSAVTFVYNKDFIK
jgi:hypothetical protein